MKKNNMMNRKSLVSQIETIGGVSKQNAENILGIITSAWNQDQIGLLKAINETSVNVSTKRKSTSKKTVKENAKKATVKKKTSKKSTSSKKNADVASSSKSSKKKLKKKAKTQDSAKA